MPVGAVLDTTPIPTLNNYPKVSTDGFGAAIYLAKETDGPVTVYGWPEGNTINGPSVPNEKVGRNVLVPRFPAETVPAAGTDGHCAIYDPVTRIIHNFYKMRYGNASGDYRWEATKYVASSIDDTGWGRGSIPDNARASGTSSMAGTLRTDEQSRSIVPHALAVAPNSNVLKTGPSDPATLEDFNGDTVYTGQFPMGTLLMLPPTFDAEALVSWQGKVIARTLKKYGARIVDTGGSFGFAGEIGSDWNPPANPNGTPNNDMVAILNGLRAVVSVSGWVDRNGQPVTPKTIDQQDLLGLYGPWAKYSGSGAAGGAYDSAAGYFIMPDGVGNVTMNTGRYQVGSTPTGSGAANQPWFKWKYGTRWYRDPKAGVTYNLTAYGYGSGISGRFEILDASQATVIAGYDVAIGQTVQVTIPADFVTSALVCRQKIIRTGTAGEAGLRMEFVAA